MGQALFSALHMHQFIWSSLEACHRQRYCHLAHFAWEGTGSREVKLLAQRDTSGKWPSRDLNARSGALPAITLCRLLMEIQIGVYHLQLSGGCLL